MASDFVSPFDVTTDRKLYADLQRASWAALTFQTYEILCTLDQEVRYIWKRPNNSWLKWAYFIVRYIPLALQICYRVIELSISSRRHVHLDILQRWYMSESIHIFVPSMTIEIVMMLRVYALYNKSRTILYSFAFLVVLETVTVFTGMAKHMPEARMIRSIDFGTSMPKPFIWLGVSSGLSQSIILLLTIVKYRKTEIYKTIPFVTLLLRDGLLVFGLITFLSIVMVIYPLLSLPFAAPFLAWTLALYSTAGTRLILNMHEVPSSREPTQATSDNYELTTFQNGLHTDEHDDDPEYIDANRSFAVP